MMASPWRSTTRLDGPPQAACPTRSARPTPGTTPTPVGCWSGRRLRTTARATSVEGEHVMQIFLFALGLIVASAVGYILGRKHGREDAEASYQRMLLIDPPRRAAGTPTNR